MKNKDFESSWHVVERSQLDVMLCLNGLRDLRYLQCMAVVAAIISSLALVCCVVSLCSYFFVKFLLPHNCLYFLCLLFMHAPT